MRPRLLSTFLHQPQKTTSESGQIAVVILLLMVVVLTIGLSIASRVSSELITSQQNQDSARVFNAAESGVDEGLAQLESSLQSGTALPTSGTISVNNSNVNFQITGNPILDTTVQEGEAVMINIVDRASNPTGLTGARTIRVEWSDNTVDGACNSRASLLMTVYSIVGGTMRARTITLPGCARGDGFAVPNVAPNNDGAPIAAAGLTAPFNYGYTINLGVGDIFARIKPVYEDSRIRVAGSGFTLPSQYFIVTSEARNATGDETRKIEFTRTLPTAPSIMDFALFSGTTIVKDVTP